jgi:hypothetical protein
MIGYHTTSSIFGNQDAYPDLFEYFQPLVAQSYAPGSLSAQLGPRPGGYNGPSYGYPGRYPPQ